MTTVQSKTVFALRSLEFEDLVNGVNESNLPIVFTGSQEECNKYAQKLGYTWKPSSKEWLGGFWYRAPGADGKPPGSMMMRRVESL